MFESSRIEKISAAKLESIAKGSPEAKYIVIVCELYFGPCIDKFYQIDEFLSNQKAEKQIDVYWFDTQLNYVFHYEMWNKKYFSNDVFGVFIKRDKSEWHKYEIVDHSLDAMLAY